MKKTKWWQVMLIVYAATLVTAPIGDLFLSRLVAACISGFLVERLGRIAENNVK